MSSVLREPTRLLSDPKPESATPRPEKGIFEWDEKWSAITKLSGGGTNYQTVKWVLTLVCAEDRRNADERRKHSQEDEEARSEVERVVGSLKSWRYRAGGSLPTGDRNRKFVKALLARLEQLGWSSDSGESIFLHAPYSEFYKLFPDAVKKLLDPRMSMENEGHTFVRDSDAFHPLWISRGLALERTKATRGRIDQKFYFLNPDSAHTWREVINSGQYRQYLECSDSLEAFLAGENDGLWREFISTGKSDGAVMLGGGGPSKDLAVIGSMLDHAPSGTKVHYALVDISIYMLMSSVQQIDSSLILQNRRSHVQLSPLIWDFMNLAGAAPKLRRKDKNVAWFLPGGTIGNLNEQTLFSSIRQEAKQDDLLIIGAEILGSTDLDAERAALVKKYKHPAIRGFLGTPLRAAWHELNIQMSLDEALDRLNIELVDGLTSRHSTISGSAAVEISVSANDEKVVLLTSTRYSESAFCEAVEAHDFKHELTVPSTRNKNYKQFIFRSVP